jgi:hypothetical protein
VTSICTPIFSCVANWALSEPGRAICTTSELRPDLPLKSSAAPLRLTPYPLKKCLPLQERQPQAKR